MSSTIYTTYFAKLKSLPKDVIPISICGRAPDWYTGAQYKVLAPKYDFFSKWKVDHDDAYFTRCFYSQVLDSLNPLEVIRDLARLSRKEWEMILNGTVHIALVCYEKSTDFCHRHLVAEWLCNNGIPCIEWKDKQSTPLLTGFVLE